MVGLVQTAKAVLGCLERAKIPACVIGGLAVQRWGEPRATQDVDLTALAPFGEESRTLDVLLSAFEPRVPDAREFAERYRVLRLRSDEGIGIDVSLAALPFELEVLVRSVDWLVEPGVSLRICSAEDLLVYKLIAARPRDLADIEGIVRAQHSWLDIGRVRANTSELAEALEAPDLLAPFEAALRLARRSR
jgi:hypothetical protein